MVARGPSLTFVRAAVGGASARRDRAIWAALPHAQRPRGPRGDGPRETPIGLLLVRRRDAWTRCDADESRCAHAPTHSCMKRRSLRRRSISRRLFATSLPRVGHRPNAMERSRHAAARTARPQRALAPHAMRARSRRLVRPAARSRCRGAAHHSGHRLQHPPRHRRTPVVHAVQVHVEAQQLQRRGERQVARMAQPIDRCAASSASVRITRR